MSTRLLYITYPFPPIAGGGVSRPLNFLSHFSEFDIEASILSVELTESDRARHSIDDSRLDTLDPSLKVFRSPTRFPYKIVAKLRERLPQRIFSYLSFLTFPFMNSQQAWWSISSIPKAIRIVREEHIQVVLTSASPHSVMLTGLFVKLFTKAKWICDLRDPYTDGYQWHWPGKLHWLLSRAIEKVCFYLADHLVVNTPEVKKLYLSRNLKTEAEIAVVTNGIA